MNTNKYSIEEQINIDEDILMCKYKELDNILNSNINKNEVYIEYLTNDIEKIEEELKNLKKISNKKASLSENVINNLHKDLRNDDNINCKNISPICDLEDAINKMISFLNADAELIKNEIDQNITNKENVIRLKNNINNIICKAFLFKENFNDYINYIKKYEKKEN